MADQSLITPTKRKRMTKARAAKIFLREQGQCYLCKRKLRVGVDPYQIEHPVPLALGGSDADEDLRVVCIPCHKPKTAQDAASKAKRDRIVTAGFKPDNRKSKRGSRPLGTGNNQRSATRPIVRKNERADQ